VIKLKAENFKLIGANRRLIPAKSRWINNPEYATTKIFMYFAFTNCQVENTECLKNNICIDIDVWTYLDIDNTIKPIVDTIQEIGIIKNDREVIELHVVKHKVKRGQLDKVEVKIYERDK
jgi:hypothetical protein